MSENASNEGASQKKVLKDKVKAARVFELLKSGKILTMSRKEFERLMEWLDK
jgi:superfamily II DNA helicase RecQ